MLARAAHLPDAVVGLLPGALEEVEQRDLERPRSRRPSPTSARAAARMIDSDVEHLAVDVELELVARRVADPHRRRALVAGEPVELELGRAAARRRRRT